MTTPEKHSELTRADPGTPLDDEHVMQLTSVGTRNRHSARLNPTGCFRQAAE